MPATKDEILDAIAEMSVLDLADLLKDFEEKFGVTAAAPVAAAAAAPAGVVATLVAATRSRRRSTSCSPAPATRRST